MFILLSFEQNWNSCFAFCLSPPQILLIPLKLQVPSPEALAKIKIYCNYGWLKNRTLAMQRIWIFFLHLPLMQTKGGKYSMEQEVQHKSIENSRRISVPISLSSCRSGNPGPPLPPVMSHHLLGLAFPSLLSPHVFMRLFHSPTIFGKGRDQNHFKNAGLGKRRL